MQAELTATGRPGLTAATSGPEQPSSQHGLRADLCPTSGTLRAVDGIWEDWTSLCRVLSRSPPGLLLSGLHFCICPEGARGSARPTSHGCLDNATLPLPPSPGPCCSAHSWAAGPSLRFLCFVCIKSILFYSNNN